MAVQTLWIHFSGKSSKRPGSGLAYTNSNTIYLLFIQFRDRSSFRTSWSILLIRTNVHMATVNLLVSNNYTLDLRIPRTIPVSAKFVKHRIKREDRNQARSGECVDSDNIWPTAKFVRIPFALHESSCLGGVWGGVWKERTICASDRLTVRLNDIPAVCWTVEWIIIKWSNSARESTYNTRLHTQSQQGCSLKYTY